MNTFLNLFERWLVLFRFYLFFSVFYIGDIERELLFPTENTAPEEP